MHESRDFIWLVPKFFYRIDLYKNQEHFAAAELCKWCVKCGRR